MTNFVIVGSEIKPNDTKIKHNQTGSFKIIRLQNELSLFDNSNWLNHLCNRQLIEPNSNPINKWTSNYPHLYLMDLLYSISEAI